MTTSKKRSWIGLSTVRYEVGRLPEFEIAQIIARYLNKIISTLIEADETIDTREFDLWRGMAAGSQAQDSWQNAKGRKIELVVQGLIRRRLRESKLVTEDIDDKSQIILVDQSVIAFADEPDIAFYRDDKIMVAVEIKGGIDKARVLEQVGAAIKSLNRAKEENSNATTILILQEVQ